MLISGETVDAYRNKMRSLGPAGGQEATSMRSYMETRVGKRKWQERKKRSRRHATTP